MRQLADTHLYGNKNQANKLNAGFVNVYDIFSTDNSITDLDNLCGNRYLKNTFKSKFKQCKLKVSFVSRDQALNSASKRFCNCVVSAETVDID